MCIADEAERLKQEWEEWSETANKPSCDLCGSERAGFNGRGKRGATVLVDGRSVHVPQFRYRRARCSRCGAALQLLPPGLIPHKHYQPCVVAKAVGQYVSDEAATMQAVAQKASCSRRTVGRWVRWVRRLADPAVVLRKVVEAVDAVIVPKVRATAKRSSALLRGAAEMLGLLEYLASATGLEPPGLRGVLCHVLRGRTGIATYARPLIPELARGQGP